MISPAPPLEADLQEGLVFCWVDLQRRAGELFAGGGAQVGWPSAGSVAAAAIGATSREQ